MIIYDLNVTRQRIFGAERIALAAEANKILALRFSFDRHWREFDSKAAIFRNHAGEYYIIEVCNNIVQIPWEVLTEAEDIELSVIAFEDETVLTTKKVTIEVSESLLPEEYQAKSASETLFDKFRRECKAEAFLDYENEIESLKRSYEARIDNLLGDVSTAEAAVNSMETSKNNEIAQLNLVHSQEIAALNGQLNEKQTEIDALTIKADKWDSVNTAIQGKQSSAQPLWSEGNAPFSLPMMDTKSMATFTSASISSKLTEVGFNLESATRFNSIMNGKTNLRKITLINTENIQTMDEMAFNSGNLTEVEIGDIPACTTARKMFMNCNSLEKVTIGQNKFKDISNMFENCFSLEEINCEFDGSTITNAGYAFSLCTNLKKISFKENTISTSISLNISTYLDKESMLSLFNGLNDETSSTVSVARHAFNTNFPTEEEKEEIIELVTETKGWILSY